MKMRIAFGVAAGLALVLAACADNRAAPPRPAGPAPVASLECTDFSFPIYFDKGADNLTAPALDVLRAGGRRARACQVAKVEVLGLADADGPAGRNLALSRRRAVVVAKALAEFGLPAPVFDIEAIGEAGAIDKRDGKPEPLRRRTEVVIHAAPRGR